MKRKDLLQIAGCSVKRFDNMQLRGHLPFDSNPGPENAFKVPDADRSKQADYSLENAFQLRIFLDAVENKGLSVEVAQYIAQNCLHVLRRAKSGSDVGEETIWLFYAQERGAPGKVMGAGPMSALEDFLQTKADPDNAQFIVLMNASMASAIVIAGGLNAGIFIPDDEPMGNVWGRTYQTVFDSLEG